MTGPLRVYPRPNASALLISPSEADFESLYPILHEREWKLQVAQSCRQADSALSLHEFPVIICQSKLPDGTWRTMQAYTRGTPAQLIVFSRLADERLWTDVLDSGGYDVLATPFHREETLRVISAAWLQWRTEGEPNRRCEPLSA